MRKILHIDMDCFIAAIEVRDRPELRGKPDGQFEIGPSEVAAFMADLPVRKLFGVGRKMDERLGVLGVRTCGDLQRLGRAELAGRFGKWGSELCDLCRGRDEREVRLLGVGVRFADPEPAAQLDLGLP